jgi:hypothetical protein
VFWEVSILQGADWQSGDYLRDRLMTARFFRRSAISSPQAWEQVLGQGGILKHLTGRLLQTALNAEMSHHL